MKSPALLIALLVSAHVLVSLVVGTRIRLDGPGPSVWGLVGIPLFISQIALMATWLCFGRFRFLVRLIVTAIVMWIWLVVYSNAGGRAAIPWSFLIMAIASAVAIVLFAFRWFGLTVARHNERHADQRESFQFSIGQLLIWMTVVAVSLGILKGGELRDTNTDDIVMCLLIATFMAPIAITSLWAALGERYFIWRFATAVLHPFAATAIINVMMGFTFRDESGYILSILITIICLLSLLVVRMAGYRLVRVRREEQNEIPIEEPADA